MAENIYNKGMNGTLVGNWWEEKELKEATGTTRTIPREHIAKKHGDLENPIISNQKVDNTYERINGKTEDQIMDTTNYQYGRAKDIRVPTHGLRTKAFEQEIMNQVLAEKAGKE